MSSALSPRTDIAALSGSLRLHPPARRLNDLDFRPQTMPI